MASRPPPLEQIDVTPGHVRALLARVRPQLSDEEYHELEALIETLLYVADIVTRKITSIARLRTLLFGACTEKTRDVLARAGVTTETSSPGGEAPRISRRISHPGRPRARPRGPARAEAMGGTARPPTQGPSGSRFRTRTSHQGTRVRAVPPARCTGNGSRRCWCDSSGRTRSAPRCTASSGCVAICVVTSSPPRRPDGVGDEKCDATSGAMIALLKYGSGVPFHRLARLQANVDLPLPASTQREIVADVATRIQPALDALIRHAANGEVLHNDDTSMTVLSLLPTKRKDAPAVQPATVDDASPDRTGAFTSGIVATRDGHRIALYLTGRRHAGEDLATVLAHRAPGLGPPIQMCDALSRYPPKGVSR